MTNVIQTLIKADDVVYTVRADGGARAAEADALATLVGANAVAESDLQTAYHKALDKSTEKVLLFFIFAWIIVDIPNFGCYNHKKRR